jgi:hypothetical protein
MAWHHAQVRDGNKVLFPVPPRVKMTSLITAAAFTLLFVFLWPGTMLRSDSNKVLYPVPPRAKMTSLITAAAFTLLFVFLWPGTMLRSERVIRFYFRFLHVRTFCRLHDFLLDSVLLFLMICTYVFRILSPQPLFCLFVCRCQFLPVSACLCAY